MDCRKINLAAKDGTGDMNKPYRINGEKYEPLILITLTVF